MPHLRQIPIRRLADIVGALNVLAFDEALDAGLDHGDVGAEAAGELGEDFGVELGMGEFLALPMSERAA